MKIFRLSRKKYSIALSGKGAARFGNRWNSKGTEIIYCAGNRALAMAEVAVHINPAILPGDYLMVEIDVPGTVAIKTFDKSLLPANWNIFPHLLSTQKIGDGFIEENKFCILKVPSAVVEGDFNFLINPYHQDFKKIKITNSYDFPFDNRLFGL